MKVRVLVPIAVVGIVFGAFWARGGKVIETGSHLGERPTRVAVPLVGEQIEERRERSEGLLEVRVEDELGQEIEQALVCALRDSSLEANSVCTTSDSGGRASLSLNPTQGVPLRLIAHAHGYTSTGRALEASVKDTVLKMRKSLEPNLVIEIVDASGGPVGGARALLSSPELSQVFLGVSDGQGRILVHLGAAQWTVSAVAEGYASSSGKVDTSLRRAAKVVLIPAAQAIGEVVDHDGVPVVNAAILDARNGQQLARTDGFGTFSVENLPTGEFHLVAESDTSFSEPRTVWLQPGGTNNLEPFVVHLGGKVHSKVTVDGRPCKFGEITLRREEQILAAQIEEGFASIPRVRGGRYEASWRCAGAQTQIDPVDVAEGLETDLSRELRGTGIVTGALRTHAGRLLRGRTVRIVLPSGEIVNECTTDDDGRFECGLGNAQGALRMEFLSSATVVAAKSIEVGSCERCRLQADLDVPNCAEVVVEAGSVSFFSVSGVDSSSHHFLPLPAEGSTARFVDLPLGTYTMAAPGHESERIHIVTDGEILKLALNGISESELIGKVVDASGTGISEAWVSAAYSKIGVVPETRVLTAPDGSFSIRVQGMGCALHAESSVGTGRMPCSAGKSGEPIVISLGAPM